MAFLHKMNSISLKSSHEVVLLYKKRVVANFDVVPIFLVTQWVLQELILFHLISNLDEQFGSHFSTVY